MDRNDISHNTNATTRESPDDEERSKPNKPRVEEPPSDFLPLPLGRVFGNNTRRNFNILQGIRDQKRSREATYPPPARPAAGPTPEWKFNLLETHRAELIYPIAREGRDEHLYVINLTELQRLNLQSLRRVLAEEAENALWKGENDIYYAREWDSNNFAPAWEIRARRIHAYCEALRDWDYMQEKWSDTLSEDPFKIVSSVARDADIIERMRAFSDLAEKWKTSTMTPDRRQKIPDDAEDPQLPFGSRVSLRKKRDAKALATRLTWGLLGGLALIAPMLLMVLHNDVPTCLGTVSVATFLFALVIAKYTDKSPLELMGTTAAYVAVLVVFVGASSSS